MSQLRTLALTLLTACGDPPLQAEGKFVNLYHDGIRTPCGGTLSALDRFVADLRAEFGAPPPTAGAVEYYWVDEDMVTDRCPRASSGCVQWPSERLYATLFPHTHEVVHAAAIPLGEAPSWLSEGLAMAYQGSDDDDVTFRSPNALELIAEARALPSDLYGDAGAWVRHLVDRFGIAAVARYYAALPRLASARTTFKQFEEVFAVPLLDVALEFRDRFDGCSLTGMSINLWECGAPELPWDGDEIVVHRTLDCAQDDVVGPYDGDLATLFHTVDVAEPGLYELRFTATLHDGDVTASGNGLALARCDSSCELGLFTILAAGDTQILALQPGRHYLELQGPAASATQVAFTLRHIRSE